MQVQLKRLYQLRAGNRSMGRAALMTDWLSMSFSASKLCTRFLNVVSLYKERYLNYMDDSTGFINLMRTLHHSRAFILFSCCSLRAKTMQYESHFTMKEHMVIDNHCI